MSSERVKASRVISVAWFRSNRNVLHHQFIIATVEYHPKDDYRTPSVFYDIKFERMGRMAGPKSQAKQSITVKPAAPLREKLRKKANELILALVDRNNPIMLDGDRAHGSAVLWHPTSLYYNDKHRRSLQMTLGLLAQYSSTIVSNAPGYHLSSTNCYFYARLIMHIVITKHFVYEYVVSPSIELHRCDQHCEIHNRNVYGDAPVRVPQGTHEYHGTGSRR